VYIYLGNFKYGAFLKMNKIESVDFKLQQTNKSTRTFSSVISALGQISWKLSDEVFTFYIKLAVVFLEASSSSGDKLITTIFQHYSTRYFGCTSTYRMLMGIEKAQLPPEFSWAIPERENPDRAKQIIQTLFLELFGICERLMAKIHPEDIQIVKELFVEEFFKQVRAKKSDTQMKLEENTDVKNLSSAIGLLIGMLETRYVKHIQLRSEKLRGVITIFKKRMTSFMFRTGLYSDPKMRENYLMLSLISYNMASEISNSNRQTSKLWKLPKSVLLNIKRADFNFQLDLAKANLRDYMPINNFCHYNKWIMIEELDFPAEVEKNYDFTEFKHNPDRFFWVFSRELCDYLFNRIITTFFKQSILFLQHFESKNMFEDIKELIDGSWISCSTEDMIQFLLWTILNVLTNMDESEDYANKIAVYIDIVLDTCMVSYVLQTEETVYNILQIGRQIMKHGTYGKCFPIYYKIIKRVIGWTTLPENLNISHLHKMVEEKNVKTDAETSLIDLLEFATRMLVFYRSWDVKFRAKLVRYIIVHCNSKDINKRIVYMSILAFLNRSLRRTDYSIKEVIINHHKFVNQNGYIDMFMLKEAFREIRANIKYSSDDTQIFTDEQNEELNKINEECIPSVVFPQYITLPFKALKLESKEGATCKYFNEAMMTLEEIELYTDTITEFIRQLIDEYSEEIDESNLYVSYEFSELLIDTKKTYKFDKDLLIFACNKIFCMFLGLKPIKIVLSKLSDEKLKTVHTKANFNKVILNFYSALLGASGYYSDEDFEEVIEMGKPILKPFFNSVGSKYLDNFMAHLNRALRGNLSYKRLNKFFNMVIELMHEDSHDHHIYYLNLFIFQIKICQMQLTDNFIGVFKKLMEKANMTETLSAANLASRTFRAINGVRMLISFTDDFIIKNKRMVTEDTLSTHLYNRDIINFDDYIKLFLKQLKDDFDFNAWMKIEGIKHIVYMVYDKKITSHNLFICKKMFQILFQFRVKDFNDVNLVVAYRDLVLDMRNSMVVQKHIKEHLLVMLDHSWDRAEAFECYKGILMVYKIGYDNKITETVHDFLHKITNVNKLGLTDDIFIFIRDDIFSKLGDTALFEYADTLIKQVDPIIDKMYISFNISKPIKDHHSADFRSYSLELESYCELLLTMIACRRWQMNAQLENILRYATKASKYSPIARKTYS
jgi:hypothetical protein